MIKTFISYSHSENQWEKEELVKIINSNPNFQDDSVDTGDIDDSFLSDEQIRTKIRDNYLKDTTVTIVLVGQNAQYRKHIDWEIYSSMYDGKINQQSGIVVIDMNNNSIRTSYDKIKKYFNSNWIRTSSWEIREEFSNYPERLIDNFVNDEAKITVIPYQAILNNNNLLFDSIELAHDNRKNQNYDLSKPIRRRNSDTRVIY